MIPLEILFDSNDVFQSSRKEQGQETEDYNIGTTAEPKMIKIFKNLDADHKERYVHLMKEFIDTFAWTYEDLK